eukprot:1102646-Rhodomonas_salina.1
MLRRGLDRVRPRTRRCRWHTRSPSAGPGPPLSAVLLAPSAAPPFAALARPLLNIPAPNVQGCCRRPCVSRKHTEATPKETNEAHSPDLVVTG